MADLTNAYRQWANRPDDERFFSLGEAMQNCLGHYESRIEAPASVARLRIEPAENQDLVLVGESGVAAEFTNYSFGQMCRMVGAPGQYLAGLPAELAAAALNHGLQVRAGEAQLLLQSMNGGASLKLRALTSEKYSRIWNWEVFQWLVNLPQGWMVPPARPAKDDATRQRPATEEDVRRWNKANVGRGIGVGSPVSPAGIYASDRDMFAFMVHEDRIIDAGGNGKEPMGRGFFVKNSEVGDATLGITMFYYSFICSNHIIWGAENVREVRIRHIGEAGKKFSDARAGIIAAADKGTQQDLQRIQAARTLMLGSGKDELIEWFSLRDILSPKRTEAAYVYAEKYSDIHGDPRSAWGMASAITRLSQESGYANERVDLDKAAAKTLSVAFERVN